MFDQELCQYWKIIIETVSDGLMVVDPEGVIVLVNRNMEQLIGYSKNELVGQSCNILGCNTCRREKTEGKDKYCGLFKELKIKRAKCTLRKKDGSLLHAIKNASVLRDDKGKVIGGVEILIDIGELIDKEKVISNLRRELSGKNTFHGMIAASPSMHQVFDLISSAARSHAPVVIYGESGTGKELVAEAVHRHGRRSGMPFIKVNCAALNESLLESELFGHVKGAFTGADNTRVGRFEAANNGSIFLDEIGDLPLSVQVKLLRVLQEKEIEKVGDHKPVSIDARIISATNQNLRELMDKGNFREDLYYRIGVIPIHLPPLRERREDIPLLINSFINRIRLKTDKPVFSMSDEAFKLLNAYDWPGNVRELINTVEYAFVLCPGEEIMPDHLPRQLIGKQHQPSSVRKTAHQQNTVDKKQSLLDALETAKGNKSEASRILGISRVSLYKRIRKYDIQVDKTIRRQMNDI
ncbi:MAG: PAS domain S-box protein [Desulfobacterales bacterium]|nr:PAS domain S-box protein [Desulfobacterales bacterium]